MTSHDLTIPPETDPTNLYRYRDGLYAADLLAAAVVVFDFFTWLAEHPVDLSGICRGFNIRERPADVMLTLFTAMGLVEQRDGLFRVTKLAAEHLVKGSPWFVGAYFASVKARPVCQDFVTVLRTGRPANWASLKTEREWSEAMNNRRFAEEFTAAMDCRGVFLGQVLAEALPTGRFRRLLDIGGGSGIYACAIAARNPELEATVLEKAPVDQLAREAVEQRGFANRVRVQTGDMLHDPLPENFDLHLLSNVLHDWDVPVVTELLRKSFKALPADGALAIHEAFINEDKTGPLPVAEYSAMLMHSTEGKCYALSEMRQYCAAAGFVDFQYKPAGADRGLIAVRKP